MLIQSSFRGFSISDSLNMVYPTLKGPFCYCRRQSKNTWKYMSIRSGAMVQMRVGVASVTSRVHVRLLTEILYTSGFTIRLFNGRHSLNCGLIFHGYNPQPLAPSERWLVSSARTWFPVDWERGTDLNISCSLKGLRATRYLIFASSYYSGYSFFPVIIFTTIIK